MKNLIDFLTESLAYENPSKAAKEIKKIFDLNAESVTDALKDKSKADDLYSLCVNNFINIVYNNNNEGVNAAKKYKVKVYASGTGFAIVGDASDEEKDLYALSIDFNEFED